MKIFVNCASRRKWWQIKMPHLWKTRGKDGAGNRVYVCRNCNVAGCHY